jgi:predicted amidophosphoribosyltransferase
MKSSRAAFTCDFCGTAVDLFADSCPSCGKRFEAVRCPRCAHQGRPGTFGNGCPQCGYLASSAEGQAKRSKPRPRALFVPLMTVVAVMLAAAFAVSWLLRPR